MLCYISLMFNSHNNNLTTDSFLNYFTFPQSQRQRQYEAVRAFFVDKLPANEIANKYDYSINTVYTLIRDFKSGKLDLFPKIKKGPKQRRVTLSYQEKIIAYRKQNKSTTEIHQLLKNETINISVRTIERIIKDAGFSKLKRRTYKEIGITKMKKVIPLVSEKIDFNLLGNQIRIDTPCAGVFFFIPYIIESGIIDIIKKCQLPKSSVIDSIQACLSMLLLKLIGNERLSHMDAYDQEPGLGFFAGLNVLPKSTYMSTYSCRTSEEMLLNFQKEIMIHFKNIYPDFYSEKFINLDFHSIPHYGNEEAMEKIWCGAKHKTMKGATTVFAQDSQSNIILYTRADILRKEESNEIKKFITYWKNIKNKEIEETLVFDCMFTKYQVLDELTDDNIKFITLRKRNKKLVDDALKIPNDKWKKVYLPIPKRKYKQANAYESQVILSGCKNTFRQIIIKNHGRENPTFILLNNNDLSLDKVLEVYAKRWHIENKLSELVAFFNLNALSSPLMIRIHFDIIWTIIADTLYHRFAQDLRRFEGALAPTIFKKFINMPGIIKYNKDGEFEIRIRKRAYTPILMGVEKLKNSFRVPWLDNKLIRISWTA
jgi:transposase